MTLTIARGRGYVAAEGNKGPETTIGVIPVDSIFSPVRRVSYDVDTARVGQRTDFDKLKLEVTTDGSMTPKDAVKDAAELLIKYLSIFTDIDAAELALRPDGGGAEVAAPSAHGMENILIEELELGVRSYNCLKRVGIETIGDLIAKTEAELAAIPNFGKKSIEEVKETLAAHGPHACGGRGVRHQRKGRKLGRDASHRKALFSNMAGPLFEHGRIRTTEAKAKELRPIAEKLITLARKDPVRRGGAAAGGRLPAQQGRGAHAVPRGRAPVHRAAGRLHAHRQARPAPGRRRPDGVHRARRPRARRARVASRSGCRRAGSTARC